MHHCLPKSDCGKHAALSRRRCQRLQSCALMTLLILGVDQLRACSNPGSERSLSSKPSRGYTIRSFYLRTMLTAKVCVQYDGDWTAELANHDVFGEFIASTFRNNRYVGMLAVESQDCNAVHEVIREHDTVETVDLIEQYEI